VYGRIAAAAARDGIAPLDYLMGFFNEVDWTTWLALMVPYSLLLFVIDAHATWRVVRSDAGVPAGDLSRGVAFLPLANRELFIEAPPANASAAAADAP
jgi:hypothetical protein